MSDGPSNQLAAPLVLGSGGSRPGVFFLSPGSLRPQQIASLEPGHSVYASDLDVQSGMTAIGTRLGRIELWGWHDNESIREPRRIATLIQGAPVLAVCLLDSFRLVSADSAGRRFLWDPLDHPETPLHEDSDGGCTCSFTRLDDGRVVGVTSAGELRFWSAEGELLNVVRGPCPPGTLALVRLNYWPAQRALVYPSRDGMLVRCSVADAAVETCPAHAGAFYAMAVDGQNLFTIGAGDGVMKRWFKDSSTAAHSCRAPANIIAAEVFADGSNRFLLVDRQGRAFVAAADEDMLRPSAWLEGQDYRTVTGPSRQVRSALDAQRRETRAWELQEHIQTRLRERSWVGLESELDDLATLDYESTALLLRAWLARDQNCVVGELKAYRQLCQNLPSGDPRVVPYLHRHLELLESVWQIAEAHQLSQRLASSGQHEIADGWLRQAADVLTGNDWVVHPTDSIPSLIQAATVTDQPFAGRWALEPDAPTWLPMENLTAETLTRKYEQIRAEEGSGNLPPAEARVVWWLSRRHIEQVELVLFETPCGDDTLRCLPCIRLQHGPGPVAMTRAMLLEVPQADMDRSAQAHNQKALSAFERLCPQGRVGAWPRQLEKAVSFALRRLRNLSSVRPLPEGGLPCP